MVLVLALWACLALGTASEESPAPEPLAGGMPFAVVWNVPTERCQRRFGIGLPLGDYGIVENQGGHFAGQNITIFYKNKFGLYPYLSQHGVPHNGGLPQRVSLDAHINRVAEDIRLLLRPAFHGLAVVDWEEWRPLWAQNWGAKRMYRTASEQWVREQHGFLLREALRVAARGAHGLLPVIAYSRLSFRRSARFLQLADLVHTIGESAALGAAGLVLWGDLSYSHSAESCANLRHYLVSTLGPYVANVTAAARECSYGQCHGHGRCVRRQPQELGSLLHLSPGANPWAAFRCHCYHGWAGEGCAQQGWLSPATSCQVPAHAHSLYGHKDLTSSDTCLPQGTWGW
ncbi:hyaluronidase-3 [Geospiza fortis]|uniref:Hyaluronidase n=1 Tax=Geospiza fortis TaxID=48883 RepID=A0A6I9HIG9_GEOFO|nr:hyaluronidase-3 [Geospiza fortis]